MFCLSTAPLRELPFIVLARVIFQLKIALEYRQHCGILKRMKPKQTATAKALRDILKVMKHARIRRFQAEQVRPHVWRINVGYSPTKGRTARSPLR